MSTSSTSNTTAAAGADFTQLSPRALSLAAAHDIEIVGCAKGFNAFKDAEIISGDCSAAEIDHWLAGYARALAEVSAQHGENPAAGPDTKFTDIEFQHVMSHVRYRNWSLVADHTGVTVHGANFSTHTKSGAEFFSFVNGFNAAGAALAMLGTGGPVDQDADGEE